MADGDSTASGMGMGMIIGLLVVLLVVVAGGFYLFAGHGSNPAAAAGQAVSGAASGAGHAVSGTVKVQ